VTDQLEYGGQFYTANGIFNEVSHYFIATNVILGQPAHEPAEYMQIHSKPIPDVLQMARNQEITDAGSALILLLAEPRLSGMIS
jgi:ADP-ribose pyrophosphatase